MTNFDPRPISPPRICGVKSPPMLMSGAARCMSPPESPMCGKRHLTMSCSIHAR